MLNYLLKGVLAASAVKLLENYRQLSVHMLKIEAAKSYLHGVRMVRQSALGLLWMGLLTGLICLGALLFHAGLFMLLPWSLKAKALLGMFLGLAYVAAGAVVLREAMSERVWMEKSGAAKMVRDATGSSRAV